MNSTKAIALSALFVASLSVAKAAAVPPDKLTVRQVVQLYTAIDALDKGGSKVVDGKEAHVPFTLSSETNWTLSGDKLQLEKEASRYDSLKTAKAAELAAHFSKDDPTAQVKLNAALDKEMTPILDLACEIDPLPVLKKISRADLQLDSNPIDMTTLMNLRLIILEARDARRS